MEENHKVICENCGKEHDGTYGSGRFCSKECARGFSTKHDNLKELKEAKCSKCGTILFINKRASSKTCLCESCKKEYHKPSDLKICKICGSEYYKCQGGCPNNFCKTHSIQGFKSLIKYFNFDENKLGTKDVENEFNRIKNIINDLYWNDNLSSSEISNKFNVKSKHSIIQTVFKFLNIKKRNLSQSTSNAYYTGKLNNNIHNKYHSSWHTTWNNKKVYLRSSYELDYAIELDKQKIDYEVESLRIKYFDTQRNEYRCAIPDFYLPETNTIVEIKSNWTLDIQNMKDKFKAYKELGYDCKLICEHKNILI